MRRLDAKKSPERPLLSVETGNVESMRQDPRRNGLFSIGDDFGGLGRLDGGVRSQIRTRLRRQFPANRELTGNFFNYPLFKARFAV